MNILEGALWKQKKTMTGVKWKKRWVRTDGIKLIQWHVRLNLFIDLVLRITQSDAKPSDKVKPKHVYNLPKCTVREIRVDRPYAFSVTDNNTGDTTLFAASKVTEYDSWLSMLIQDVDEEKSEGNSAMAASESKLDVLHDFFETHSISKVIN
jgi:hypothetical protein